MVQSSLWRPSKKDPNFWKSYRCLCVLRLRAELEGVSAVFEGMSFVTFGSFQNQAQTVWCLVIFLPWVLDYGARKAKGMDL